MNGSENECFSERTSGILFVWAPRICRWTRSGRVCTALCSLIGIAVSSRPRIPNVLFSSSRSKNVFCLSHTGLVHYLRCNLTIFTGGRPVKLGEDSTSFIFMCLLTAHSELLPPLTRCTTYLCEFTLTFFFWNGYETKPEHAYCLYRSHWFCSSVEQPLYLFRKMHCLEEPLNALGDIMDREKSTLNGNIGISALKKF